MATIPDAFHGVLLAAVALALAEPARAQENAGSPLWAAESALARGELDRAVGLARDYTSHHRDDWRGWFLQGEATLRRGGASNLHAVEAIIAFRRATRLAPGRPEVWDGYGRAGIELGSSDGELIVHEAYEQVLALDPLYPRAFENWLKAYASRSDRRRVRRILARHDSLPEVRARIARLLIEDERYTDANVILDSLLALDHRDPEWLALRAQSALESGDTLGGAALYARALDHADRPSGEALWEQAVGIATPEEIRAWDAGVPREARSGFLRGFWARRNPDLFAGINRALAEHFRRLRYARKEFPDFYPLSSYKNRALTRALNAAPSLAEQIFWARCEARESPGGPVRASDRARLSPEMERLLANPEIWQSWRHPALPGELYLDPERVNIAALALPYAPDIQSLDTTAAATGYNLRTRLSDRGVTYLRFGAPRTRLIGAPNGADAFCQTRDLERWVYDDIGTVRFFVPGAVSVGAFGAAGMPSTDKIFRPMTERQSEAMDQVMTRDASSIPAPLSFRAWTAQFAGAESASTDVVVVTTRGAAAAQLVGVLGPAEAPRQDGAGIVTLHAAPGWYVLLADARVGETLGRHSLRLSVSALGARGGVSDLLAAPAWADTVVTRTAMLGHLQRDLTFVAGTTLRFYAEIYGLRPSADGAVRYRVAYQLYRSDNLVEDAQRRDLAGGVRIAFDRAKAAAGDRAVEWLDVAAGWLPPGGYLLRLEVEGADGAPLGRAQIGFEIR